MAFASDTYICLDVPAPFAQRVMDMRIRHCDEFRATLPAEITVAGSSGVGVFTATQDSAMAFATLDTIAAKTSPIEASFGAVRRFPGTDIFVLLLRDAAPFHALHQRIAISGLRFERNPFPFQPHCTLRSRSPVSEEVAAELLAFRIPGSFVMDTLSVYMLDRLPMTLLHRVRLTGIEK
ncbi:MAG TPA: 2'-5' RNA ligase family protein [Ktedonobacteraceae bacterium]|nr:2'-5' RNA ligase family protein [Ktedonobacteraceae bacterium]